MIDLLIGVGLGVGGMIVKDKLAPGGQQGTQVQTELNTLSDENEKLRRRYKEAERQIEDLLAENAKLKKMSKTDNDDKDDLEDSLDNAKSQIKKLTAQNDELLRKVQEYKLACENYEAEINRLKQM